MMALWTNNGRTQNRGVLHRPITGEDIVRCPPPPITSHPIDSRPTRDRRIDRCSTNNHHRTRPTTSTTASTTKKKKRKKNGTKHHRLIVTSFFLYSLVTCKQRKEEEKKKRKKTKTKREEEASDLREQVCVYKYINGQDKDKDSVPTRRETEEIHVPKLLHLLRVAHLRHLLVVEQHPARVRPSGQLFLQERDVVAKSEKKVVSNGKKEG